MRFSKYLVAAAMAFFTLTASSQSSAVRGVVVDAQGEAIIGATIKLKNGKALGATDVDGRFTLSSVKPGEKIEITYVGMKPQVVTVSSNMKITLVSDEQLLEEVVVTAFGVCRFGCGGSSQDHRDQAAHQCDERLARRGCRCADGEQQRRPNSNAIDSRARLQQHQCRQGPSDCG